MYVHKLKNERREMSHTQLLELYKVIVRCDGHHSVHFPRPSAHHVTWRLKKWGD